MSSSPLADRYRKNVIDHVRERPVLWDPTHPRYKDKGYRKKLWEEIDELLKFPPEVSSKEIWEYMGRGFANALGRKRKRANKGQEPTKGWRFEKDMMFLLPVKALRGDAKFIEFFSEPPTDATSMVSETGEEASQDTDQLACSTSYLSSPSSCPVENNNDDDDDENGFNDDMMDSPAVPKQEHSSPPDDYSSPYVHFQKKQSRGESDHLEDTLLELLNLAKRDRTRESPRLAFFQSLMEVVDTFNEDQFLNLQLDVIQAVQKQKNASSKV